MTKTICYFDIECFRNYFLVMFMLEDGRTMAFDSFEDEPLAVDNIARILTHRGLEHTSFNGNNYDIPMLKYAMSGATCSDLKDLSDEIITTDIKRWDIERRFALPDMEIDHVDLIEVAPGQNGLKVYGGRLHLPKLQDLPIDPDTIVTRDMLPMIRHYCKNDLLTTQALRSSLQPSLDLRVALAQRLSQELEAANVAHLFGSVDMRSKSDAQIAETVLKQRVFLATGAIPRKRPLIYRSFKYEAPNHIQFKLPVLREVLDLVTSAKMVINDTGHVAMPPEVEKLVIRIGSTDYKIGIGGLHSQESEVSHYADDEHYLRDIDVRSYYPNLMLNMGMYPDSMGPHFLTAYRGILDERLAAKDAGDKVTDAVLKITLNGTFGKTSSMYSTLYNPKMMLTTTLTGQLSILMLIELLERGGITVVSANTDGIVIRAKRSKEELQRKVVSVWEQVTNLETEETDYRSIHSRDVNSYIAVKRNGDVKTKGFFALPKSDRDRLAKSPQNEICVEAVINYLSTGAPIESTVRSCTDIRKFLTLRRVTGGAVTAHDGHINNHLGKVVRWYCSTQGESALYYATSMDRVPRTKGAAPTMNLPEHFPEDVHMDWYIAEANEMLMAIGVNKRPLMPKLPRRGSKKWVEMESNGLVETDDDGKPTWTQLGVATMQITEDSLHADAEPVGEPG